MKNENLTFEPKSINLYLQKALRPINKRFYYSSYVNRLPIKPSDRVLEFGPGIGTVAGMLVRKLSMGELTCVDISNRYLNATRKHLKDFPNTSFLHGKLTNMNLKTNYYDVINIHFVLHDISRDSRQILVNEMFRLLRPGGQVFVREPLRSSHGLPKNEIKTLFAQAGFFPLNEEISKNRIYGELFTACYAKISTIQFFFS
jgi:ubiquinone/menaquinone biosynthesis C-methylase UbiE